MFPSTSLQQNLRLPETGLSFLLNYFLSKSNFSLILNPLDFNNSSNQILLKKIDTCDETRGKISFLPLEYLESLFNDKTSNNIINKLDKKKYIITKLIEEKKFNKNFFDNNTFKNIPLKYLRKLYIHSDLTKTKDFSILESQFNTLDISKINQINLFDTKNIIRNKNEWICAYDIIEFIESSIYILSEFKRNMIKFLKIIIIRTHIDLDIYLSNMFDWELTEERFIIFFILFNSHFTCIIIDTEVNIKNKKKKIAFLFNSCGYNPSEFENNSDYWFIDSSLKIINHDDIKINKSNNNNSIVILMNVLKNKLKITNFVMNTFSIQNFDSECGIFSTFFLYIFINAVEKKNLEDINILFYKYIYFNMFSYGGDLIYSMIRGLIFFTKNDLDKNNISLSLYNMSPYIYEIRNNKFLEYKKIFIKNLYYIINKISPLCNMEWNMLKNI